MATLCRIYRSARKVDTYLYLAFGKETTDLPELLFSQLGELSEVMLLDLDRRDTLANADIDKVRESLSQEGYYLQLPPGPEKFLNIGERSVN